MKPHFITLEGSEACGKSTQIERLKARLEARGDTVLLTREPGGTALGETLRHLLKHAPEGRGMCAEAELLLFTASRAQLCREVIAPTLAAGGWVISDRFGDSTTVYQGVARKLAPADVASINHFAMGAIRPSLTIVLDLDPEEAKRRLLRRPRPVGQATDRMEDQPADFFDRVREGYRALAQAEPDRVKLISAAGKLNEVEETIWSLVSHAFSL
ncbi:MAG: dTMP kinase [Verrucomicrobia bacterium Tous-C9LFEB]|nr:MAG: dTMP kinase [Verrucomicrobia bacterium Tous-C9LFEB]